MKTLPLIAILVALCFILTYVEILVPINLIVPGAKLGLSNLVVLYALYSIDTKSAFFINVIRITLSALLFSSVLTWSYSITGGILSFISMYLIKKTNKFSVIAVSAVGGILHNVGQILVAILIFSTSQIAYYLPVLILIGMITGIINGFISAILIRRIGKFHLY